MHETSERFEEALKCYDEAIDLFVNDSLRQAFSGFVDVLRMVCCMLPTNISTISPQG